MNTSNHTTAAFFPFPNKPTVDQTLAEAIDQHVRAGALSGAAEFMAAKESMMEEFKLTSKQALRILYSNVVVPLEALYLAVK